MTSPKGRAYRTRNRAGQVFPVARIAATITHPEYDKALTTTKGKNAFLQPTSSSEIRVHSGAIIMDGQKLPSDASQLTAFFLQDFEGKLSAKDVPILNVLFSTLKNAIDEYPDLFLGQQKKAIYSVAVVRLYVPELMEALGAKAASLNTSSVEAFVERLAAFNTVLGIIKDQLGGGRLAETAYPLVSLIEYDSANNTVSICSPYMVAIYERLMKPRTKPNVSGRKNAAIPLPNYASIIDSRLYGQKSTRAIRLVQEIVLLIVRTGSKGTPHITVRHLIQRVPELAAVLEDDNIPSKDKSQIIARTFKTAWEYLEKYTLLKQKYCDLQFPTIIPRLQDMDSTLKFPHKGKISS